MEILLYFLQPMIIVVIIAFDAALLRQVFRGRVHSEPRRCYIGAQVKDMGRQPMVRYGRSNQRGWAFGRWYDDRYVSAQKLISRTLASPR
jgi:hypothetical protein